MVSRTGRREACQAGRKLAAVRRQIETSSHISGPLGSKKKSRPTLNMSLTIKAAMASLTGHAASVTSAQLHTPITKPSITTMSHTAGGEAPIAKHSHLAPHQVQQFERAGAALTRRSQVTKIHREHDVFRYGQRE